MRLLAHLFIGFLSSAFIVLRHLMPTLEDSGKSRVPSGRLQESRPCCFAHRGAKEV